MQRSWFCVVGLFAVLGCAPLDSEGVEGPSPALTSSEEALFFAATEPNLPSDSELPDCWWASSDEACQHRCGQKPGVTAPVRPRRRSRSRGTIGRTSAGLSLTTPDDDCPVPGGIPACPHCFLHPWAHNWGVFTVGNDVASRVVIADANGAYQVKNFPELAAAPGADPNGTHDVWLNLNAGETLATSGGGPDIGGGGDLYLHFSLDTEINGQSGGFTDYGWVKCPATGYCAALQ